MFLVFKSPPPHHTVLPYKLWVQLLKPSQRNNNGIPRSSTTSWADSWQAAQIHSNLLCPSGHLPFRNLPRHQKQMLCHYKQCLLSRKTQLSSELCTTYYFTTVQMACWYTCGFACALMGDVTSRHVGALGFCLGLGHGSRVDLRLLEEVRFIISGRGFTLFIQSLYISVYTHKQKCMHTEGPGGVWTSTGDPLFCTFCMPPFLHTWFRSFIWIRTL